MNTRQPLTPLRPSGRWVVAARWMASFVGFPLGGLAAMVIVGSAAIGGLITGAILGAAQALGLGRLIPPVAWVVATAAGLAVGLGIGATAVGFATDLAALAIQGAVCGLAVGAAQAVVLFRAGSRLAPGWPVLLAGSWALAWALITLAGVQVDDQFTVFGAIGAVTVTAITLVLPLTLARPSVRMAS
jgi:hypothetical protein